MHVGPRTALSAAAVTAALVAVSGCAVTDTAASGRVAADAGAPVAAERVESSLAAPQLQVPGDFPAPDLRTPSDPSDAGSSANGSDASSGAAGGDVAPADVTAGQSFEAPPGLGAQTRSEVPDSARQLLVAFGEEAASTENHLVLYQREDATAPWQVVRVFAAHNGRSGWAQQRREGDGSTPAGVFGLSDAGGALTDPDSKLPYTRNPALRDGAAQVYGEDYRKVFDYVIAIDYNRKPGTPPTDNTRPMGWDAGGKIWLHVDHDSPTRGCVTVPADDMQYLLQTIDPDLDPHIAMGPADVLGR